MMHSLHEGAVAQNQPFPKCQDKKLSTKSPQDSAILFKKFAASAEKVL